MVMPPTLLCTYSLEPNKEELAGDKVEAVKAAAKRSADFSNRITADLELSKSEARAVAYLV
jgi:hypothetical protein